MTTHNGYTSSRDWRDDLDPLTLIPLHIETFFDNHLKGKLRLQSKISDATAFVFYKDDKNYLITNWHVVTGRNPDTKVPLSKKSAIPNIIKVWFHSLGLQRAWWCIDIPLLNWNEEPLWKEHIRGSWVDLVALPLNDLVYKNYPLDPVLFNTQMKVSPLEAVSVIGFPFGLPSTGSLPIWKVGHVASEIGEDYGGKPVFLIDGAIRPGMSGSPVFARKKEFLSEDKRIFMSFEHVDKFLGVFSGGISARHNTGIGMVWKPELINEIIDQTDAICAKAIKYQRIDLSG